MIQQKKGQTGEGLVMIYRLALMSLVAIAVFAGGNFAYEYHIDVKNAEAHLIARGVAQCLFGNGVFYPDRFDETETKAILEYCGYKGTNIERVYVSAIIAPEQGEEIHLYQGDSGKGWVRKLFEAVGSDSLSEHYVPGRIENTYTILVERNGKKISAKAKMEVIVSNDVK